MKNVETEFKKKKKYQNTFITVNYRELYRKLKIRLVLYHLHTHTHTRNIIFFKLEIKPKFKNNLAGFFLGCFAKKFFFSRKILKTVTLHRTVHVFDSQSIFPRKKPARLTRNSKTVREQRKLKKDTRKMRNK